MQERYFYHSFPRRGGDLPTAINKGCKILSAIRDFGLVLMPEYIEWKQPCADDSERIFPVLQKRVCFTELSPSELPNHSKKFGDFALEFDIDTLRRLGAIPVFYIPQPTVQADGNALGVALLGIAMDASVVVNRLSALDQVINGPAPVPDQLEFNVQFARSPNGNGTYPINSAETRNLLRAIGHQTTPWAPLHAGMQALLNFFYPADNINRDKALEYYRQREWRIACAFAINGRDVLREPTTTEKEQLLEIDRDFFARKLRIDLGKVEVLNSVLICSGINGQKLIEMVRRVIVPPAAVSRATAILSSLSNPPQVISILSI